MLEILQNFFDDFQSVVYQGLFDWLTANYINSMRDLIHDLVIVAMQIERVDEVLHYTYNTVRSDAVSTAYSYMYNTMLALLIVFFLYKGFKIYILWRDGDAEVPPQSMVIGAISAMILAAAFPYLYIILCDGIFAVGNYLSELFVGNTVSFLDNMGDHQLETGNILGAVSIIVFYIMAFVLICKMVARGVEMLVLRLAFPIACLGLINSDGGMFKQYMGVFFRVAALSVIQMVCFSLAVCSVVGGLPSDMILGFAFMITAFSAPKLMAQFLPNTGGSNMGAAVSTLTMIIRTAAVAA